VSHRVNGDSSSTWETTPPSEEGTARSSSSYSYDDEPAPRFSKKKTKKKQPFWKELQQMHVDGKLSPLVSRLYFSPTRPMFELFDLETDPNEFNNLIGSKEQENLERELKARLQEWMILERDFLPLPVPPNP